MKHPDSVILVFSKAPVAGEVKTRLVPYLTYEQAAGLHEELTHDRLQMCCDANLCDVQLWCSPDVQHPFFIDCAQRYDIPLQLQSGNDLGERMSHAIKALLGRNKKIIIIGSDAPALDTSTIDAVINALRHNDVVLVPAEDGGYVPWGTEDVLADTVRNIRRLDLEYSLYGQCWDVDRPEDLERYKSLKM